MEWILKKRYRQFEELSKSLKVEFLDENATVEEEEDSILPKLPKKRWFEKQRWLNRFDDTYSYNRRISLQGYLRTLVKTPEVRRSSQALIDFLDPPSSLNLLRDFRVSEAAMLKELKDEEAAAAALESAAIAAIAQQSSVDGRTANSAPVQPHVFRFNSGNDHSQTNTIVNNEECNDRTDQTSTHTMGEAVAAAAADEDADIYGGRDSFDEVVVCKHAAKQEEIEKATMAAAEKLLQHKQYKEPMEYREKQHQETEVKYEGFGELENNTSNNNHKR